MILSMPEPSLISVREAAERLGNDPASVRQRIAAGRLPAVKRGRDWWIDEREVQRMVRQRPSSGRPLSQRMAWSVLLLASGNEAAASQVAGRDRYRSRMSQWLKRHPLDEYSPQLRERAISERFAAHPSELPRILSLPDVLPTGVSAASEVGLVGKAKSVEVYAPASRRAGLIAQHGLIPGDGPVQVRWAPDDIWGLISQSGSAPRAAVLVDLLESDEPRARREATLALRP
jgi:excisionase family DNA binding protein